MMSIKKIILLSVLTLLSSGRRCQASGVQFAPRELFRIPFGKDGSTLGARIDGGNFLVPRDFTMDGEGHFYIYDSIHHRIARYSSAGRYEMGIRYPATADQIFAHPDARGNLWLLITDPERGLYYGVYDTHGKRLREGVFSKFDHFRLHLDDEYTLHVIITSKKDPTLMQTYLLDQESLLMKKENVARPPEDHHRVRRTGKNYFVDPVPSSPNDDLPRKMQVTDEEHHSVARLKGDVVYVTDDGEIYTRVGDREINLYDVDGSLKGKVHLEGLAAACASVRFDSAGNIYELDGIPDDNHRYSPSMPGMRLLLWERH